MADGSQPADRDRQRASLGALRRRASLAGLDAPVDSPAIRRLIEEVRLEEANVSRSYNRTHNRHNR